MEELQIFKGKFLKMKAENTSMREKLNRLRKEQSKENNGSAFNSSNRINKSLQIESRVVNKFSTGADKLSEYESIIRKMQNLNR